jgi:hypothetical protein
VSSDRPTMKPRRGSTSSSASSGLHPPGGKPRNVTGRPATARRSGLRPRLGTAPRRMGAEASGRSDHPDLGILCALDGSLSRAATPPPQPRDQFVVRRCWVAQVDMRNAGTAGELVDRRSLRLRGLAPILHSEPPFCRLPMPWGHGPSHPKPIRVSWLPSAGSTAGSSVS